MQIQLITDLLNRKPKGVLVDKIYSIGDEEIINAEVDISSILTENNHYIVNIISQELRFEKKINFYKPITTFIQAGKEPTPTSDRMMMAVMIKIKGKVILMVIQILPLQFQL